MRPSGTRFPAGALRQLSFGAPGGFSCKKRGFCPSCGARRMAETAALLADEVFSDVPLRQWVISFPFPLRFLFAAHPQAMGKVLGIVYRAISTHLIHDDVRRVRRGRVR